nr:Hpt domain-containing protein [Gemmatimonadaceae bacterium]
MHPDRLRALFLAEGRECAASLDAALLALDRAPADADARERAFRALHTLKGMGATLALEALTALVHAGEALLAAARTRGALDAAWREPLAGVLASVQRALDDFERGTPLADATMIAQATALRSLLEAASAPAAAPTIAHMPARDDSLAPPPLREVSAAAAPVRTARIPVERLDALLDLAGDLLIARDRLLDLLPAGAGAATAEAEARRDAADALARAVDRMRDAVVTARLVPVSHVLDRFPRHVRDTAHALGKDVDLVIEGRDLEVDRSILDDLGEPLVHLVRNALDHGLERPDQRVRAGKAPVGRLVIRLARDGDMLAVTVADDGAGMDRARIAAGATALGV